MKFFESMTSRLVLVSMKLLLSIISAFVSMKLFVSIKLLVSNPGFVTGYSATLLSKEAVF